MQVRVRGLGSLARHARNRPSKGHPAPNGGYGWRVRSVALATTRSCSGFHPLVFAGLAAPHFAHVRRGVMLN